ncbi:anaphase promoting complex subunit morula [Arctopsyche grandis]|uniref:anaphase promoting complex subunit morula n=1 Tax=Arctopsyche grandis TaxID=121162 RepID=UPI00406D8686
MSTQEVWQQVVYAFPVLSSELDSDITLEEFQYVATYLGEMNLTSKIIDVILSNIEAYLRKFVAPEFWKVFLHEREEAIKGFELFESAVEDLYDVLSRFGPMLERLEKLYELCPEKKLLFGESDVIAGFKQIVRATLLSQLPLDFQHIIEDFYKISFNVFCFADTDSDQCELGEDMIHCGGCGYELENECQCQCIIHVFHETNRKLVDLQLLERLTGQVLTNLIQQRIENYVQESCKGTFDVSHIAALEAWLESTVMSWLTRIYCGGSTVPPSDNSYIKDAIDTFKQKLTYYLYETYTRIRIDQLFNIIIEYPDSQPAIEDIKICLRKTELRSTLSRKLQAALESRLLHPGVNTPDILTAYIAAIRALRHLDPSGVLLVTVTQPVRNYLRTRDDTVRSVVISLTEEGPGSELAEELARVSSDATAHNATGNEDDVPWEKWCPDPVDADPNTSSKYHRSSDIISMLVSVYGSKELFVNEYRTLLADRLLAQGVVNAEKEIRYLELLKIRFGESQLHFCEVMLKDISDSKRINGLIETDPIFETAAKKFSTNAMILSAQFWPPFKDETLELPTEVKTQLEIYTKAFEALKGNRTLNWKPHLGTVNIEIEIGDKTMDLNVSPMQATIIMHFQEKPEWYLDDLSQVMKVPATVLRRKMTYWQSLGLMSVTSLDKYILIEHDESGSRAQMTPPSKKSQELICGEEEESPMASALDQREGELQVFWSYVVGMLTNLDSMPLERIHQMLKMFASQDSGTECSIQKLRHFLDTKVRNHQLILQAGLYKLPKG